MLFSEYILSKEFDMGYLSLEDIYPDDPSYSLAFNISMSIILILTTMPAILRLALS